MSAALLDKPTVTRPAARSEWLDEVLDIHYIVERIEGDEAIVDCRCGRKRWPDALHVSLFGTELTFVH